MDSVLIDTDVLLDFFFDRPPFSIHAANILALCETGKLKGFVTPVIISNLYYLLCKTAGHEKVIHHLKKLLAILEVAVIDKDTMIKALDSTFKDFEDALQNFSAVKDKEIGIILTRNIRDYKASSLSVMSPEIYLHTKA